MSTQPSTTESTHTDPSAKSEAQPAEGTTLGSRLVLANVASLLAVILLLSAYFILDNQSTLKEQIAATESALRGELAKMGGAVARNIARSSERALAVGNYFFLSEVVRAAVKDSPELSYGAIIDTNGRAVVHTDSQQAGQVLLDTSSAFAREQTSDAIQEVKYAGEPVLEAISPVVTAGKHWGVVRIGLSLTPLRQRIAASDASLRARTRRQLGIVGAMALLSALAGAFIALMGARWLTRPLEQLLASVNRVTQGDLSHQADVAEIREFQTLASAFNSMTAAVQDREKQLAEALVEVETALEAEEQANRLKSEFMANVSHELRTPLNAMLNVPVVVLADLPEIPTWCCSHCNEEYADVLPGAEHDADPYEEDAEANTLQGSDGAQAEVDHPGYAASHEPKPCPDCNAPMSASSRVEFVGDPTELRLLQTDALHAGRHLLNVITDILDFSRLEAGRVELALEDGVQVASVLRDLQATVGALGSDKNVCMETTAISPEIAMRTDRVKLSQILLNLVSNAMKFSPEGAKVLVCAKPAELKGQPAVEFSVEDFGEGIPEEAQALIFERFRQVDSGHTRRRGGTGLGLAITKSLVDLLDGTISVRSSVDTGSAFYVVLPLAGPAEALEDAASEPTGRSGAPALPDHARRVVVVDDDPRQLGIMGKALRQSGFEVELHSDSDAALAALQTSTPDAVVLDIMMPHVCGLTLLRILKEREESKEVPVVVTSAYHNNRDIVRRLGGVWLPKPWNTNHFVRTLTTQLKRNKLHDARAQKQHVGRGET